MAIKQFELYLDESGDFNEGKAGHSIFDEPSMVGGLLCDPAYMTKERIDQTFKSKVHACSDYKKSYLSLLKTIRDAGCVFVVFENAERIRVINSNYTYINIISEGLVHLFQDLKLEYPEGVSIKVVIAQRQMELREYQNRVTEKVILALGRKQVTGVDYELVISDARTDKRLYFADIICNTWLTRGKVSIKNNGQMTDKFSLEERLLIYDMYDPRWIYSVFEDVKVTHLKQLMEDRQFGEAMHQLCALPKQTGFVKIRNKIVKEIEGADSYEQDTWLNQMSLLIGQYNRLRRYNDGIWVAENYIKYFLDAFSLQGHMKAAVPFWRFDTDFYLLTMYDHVGNTTKCQEHLLACKNNISVVNRSWEHIDYYFGFCIRELNVLMGRFAFEEVIERASRLEEIFIEARDLFGMIKTYNQTEQAIRSELLGKVYGVKLEAMINLLHTRPELFNEALAQSDKAIAEFSDSRDLSRQYQFRCLLMVEAKKPEEAYQNLLKALEITPEDENPITTFIDKAFAMRKGSFDFLLWHYSNVMLLLKEANDPWSDEMAKALISQPQFLPDANDKSRSGHPWNLVLWNVARYMRATGDHASYKRFYRRAMEITRENKANVTMLTFGLSMSADRLLWCWEHDAKDTASAQLEFSAVCKEIQKAGITNEMSIVFQMNKDGYWKNVTNANLQTISTGFLK